MDTSLHACTNLQKEASVVWTKCLLLLPIYTSNSVYCLCLASLANASRLTPEKANLVQHIAHAEQLNATASSITAVLLFSEFTFTLVYENTFRSSTCTTLIYVPQRNLCCKVCGSSTFKGDTDSRFTKGTLTLNSNESGYPQLGA